MNDSIWNDEPTRIDIIARTPAALDALVLGDDEADILMALADLDARGAAALEAV